MKVGVLASLSRSSLARVVFSGAVGPGDDNYALFRQRIHRRRHRGHHPLPFPRNACHLCVAVTQQPGQHVVQCPVLVWAGARRHQRSRDFIGLPAVR